MRYIGIRLTSSFGLLVASIGAGLYFATQSLFYFPHGLWVVAPGLPPIMLSTNLLTALSVSVNQPVPFFPIIPISYLLAATFIFISLLSIAHFFGLHKARQDGDDGTIRRFTLYSWIGSMALFLFGSLYVTADLAMKNYHIAWISLFVPVCLDLAAMSSFPWEAFEAQMLMEKCQRIYNELRLSLDTLEQAAIRGTGLDISRFSKELSDLTSTMHNGNSRLVYLLDKFEDLSKQLLEVMESQIGKVKWDISVTLQSIGPIESVNEERAREILREAAPPIVGVLVE